jgi:hypothetical protein
MGENKTDFELKSYRKRQYPTYPEMTSRQLQIKIVFLVVIGEGACPKREAISGEGISFPTSIFISLII